MRIPGVDIKENFLKERYPILLEILLIDHSSNQNIIWATDDYKGLTRDVSDKGHWGVGDYEIKLKSENDFDYFVELFKQSYDEKI